MKRVFKYLIVLFLGVISFASFAQTVEVNAEIKNNRLLVKLLSSTEKEYLTKIISAVEAQELKSLEASKAAFLDKKELSKRLRAASDKLETIIKETHNEYVFESYYKDSSLTNEELNQRITQISLIISQVEQERKNLSKLMNEVDRTFTQAIKQKLLAKEEGEFIPMEELYADLFQVLNKEVEIKKSAVELEVYLLVLNQERMFLHSLKK